MNQNLKIPARIFSILGGESGLRIFLLLNKEKELCVSEISHEIGLSISATSHQLQKIESAGLIDSFRNGKNICYTFKPTPMNQEIAKCINQIVKTK